MNNLRPWAVLALTSLALLLDRTVFAASTDTLNWRTNQNRVTADIKSSELRLVLEKIALVTGWKVYVEPETFHLVSTKFENLPPGDALHHLLGDVNFALIPANVTNASSKLFVFRTTMQKATQLIHAAGLDGDHSPKVMPNELVVRLKPGQKIEDLARLLGAKVIGQIDSLNAYRLKFDDQAATDAAREQLATNPNVASVEDNQMIDRPTTPQPLASTSMGPPQLQLKTPPETGRVIIGLVDTAVQTLGNGLDSFLLKAQSAVAESTIDPNSPTHGTGMAETILRSLEATTKGGTSVQILPVNVYGSGETTSTFDVANGIVLAYNGGAQVINLSLGSEGDSQTLRDLIQQLSSKGIVFFAAKGNQPVTNPFYPAADPGVTPVTALDNGQLASYANRADIPSVGAPGTSVIYFDGKAYYVMGTSVSTAYVSGMAAGYMDTAHKSATDAQTFILNKLTVK